MKFKPFWCLVDARTGCFYLVQFDSILKSFMAIFCLSYIFMWESCLWLHFELKEDSTGKVSFKVRKGSPMGHLVPAVAAYNSQGVHPCLQHHDFHPFAPLG